MPPKKTRPTPAVEPTLKGIAEAAGVSRSTVSRALLGHPAISSATRERVCELARLHGYAPNRLLAQVFSGLRDKRTTGYRGTLAWIETMPEDNQAATDPIFLAFFEGASRQADRMGFKLERFRFAQPGYSIARLVSILEARGIEGAVILPHHAEITAPRYLHEFPLGRFQTACIGAQLAWAHISAAMNDQHMSTRVAHQRLLQLGYRKVGLVLWRFHVELLAGRFVGGFRSLPGLENAPVLVLGDSNDLTHALSGEEIARIERFASEHGLDALVTSIYSEIFADALAPRRPDGLRIAWATLDRRGDTSLAGIEQHHERVSAAAVESVVNNILHQTPRAPEHVKTILLEGEWIDGPSAPQLELSPV